MSGGVTNPDATEDTPNYRSIVLDSGKLAVTKAIAQKQRIQAFMFKTGDAYNFVPTGNASDVSGTTVFVGDASLIQSTILAPDKARFSLIIPEAAGGFTIGNIMLYVVNLDTGELIPFIWYVSKVPYPKRVPPTDGTIRDRLIFTMTEKIFNIGDALTITVQPPEYFSLAQYRNEEDLLRADLMLFQQFILQNPKFSNSPILAARRSYDNQIYGSPLYSRLDEPFFGVLDGGRASESRSSPYKGRWFWGAKLGTDNSKITHNYGGLQLTDTPDTNIGGIPLPDKRFDDSYYLNGKYIWGGMLEFNDTYYLNSVGGVPLGSAPPASYGGVPLSEA